jgi:uracil-DNA glycosylase family 4
MDLQTFDWKSGSNYPFVPREIITNWDVGAMGIQETQNERKLRMLRQLNNTCLACTMCELGRKDAEKNGTCRDPHVLSNMNPSSIFVCGQGPGWDELKERAPFVGASGKNFDKELAKHDIDRSQFYITNTCRCFVTGNARPPQLCVNRCKPFLMMEIGLMHPKLVVTLGSVAFEALCPGAGYQQSLGKITKSEEFNVKVFAVYHPSPLNLADKGRRSEFEHQIAILAGIVKKLSKTIPE